MRLYHPISFTRFPLRLRTWWEVFLIFSILTACNTSQPVKTQISVNLSADKKSVSLQLPAGSTVQQALNAAGITLGSLDRAEPPLFTILNQGDNIRVVRVSEKFDVEQVTIPFEHQTLRNESLSKDARVYLQQGKNGLQENTIRRVFEDGVEVSNNWIKSTVIQEPVSEIIMTGVQAPFVSVNVPGRLVYLRDGNAWVIERSTGNRRAIVTKGDLDGYVFSLSSDGSWLLFTRKAKEKDQINTLWAVHIDINLEEPIDLGVKNVVYFADWLPGSNTQIGYSTVTPQVAAPGWKSNNDLNYLTIINPRRIEHQEIQLRANLGGVYPWWGVSFDWASKSIRLAYANDHQVGILDLVDKENQLVEGESRTLLRFPPLKTNASWAWVPGISWGPDEEIIYTVDHVAVPGMSQPEESQRFDLTALPLVEGAPLHLVTEVGMFAYPLVSPFQSLPAGEQIVQVAYLQAAFPNQSETSRYRLAVMDRDGSNRQILYPPEGFPGLTPQQNWGAWSPEPMPDTEDFAIALLDGGNLWIIDSKTGEAHQITGDGLTTRVAWNAVR